MKIKELFEATALLKKQCQWEICFYFPIIYNKGNRIIELGPLRAIVEKYVPKKQFKLANLSDVTFNVIINDAEPILIDKQRQEDIIQSILKDVAEINPAILKTDYQILNTFNLNYIPSTPLNIIKNSNLVLNFSANTLSLENFYNIFKSANDSCEDISLYGDLTHIKSNVLSLLKFKKSVNFKYGLSAERLPWFKIVNKHLRSDRDIIACHEELVDAGLEEYAQF